PRAVSGDPTHELGIDDQVDAAPARRRLADPGAGGHRRAGRTDPGDPAGRDAQLAAGLGSRAALRLHLLLPRHAAAGAAVPGLLRRGAVRGGPPERVVAGAARSLLV